LINIKNELINLGFIEPEKNFVLANYKPYTIYKDNLYISGQLPLSNGKILYTGQISLNSNMEEVKKAIRLAASNLLWTVNSAMKREKKKIAQAINIKGYLQCEENFNDQSKIFDEASNLIVSVLGSKFGSHSRSVVGVKTLPKNSQVEIEGLFAIL
tara:strand:- start:541 stop:1008 length:468 start_codon:yes stop_codon:yes gene_type:complete